FPLSEIVALLLGQELGLRCAFPPFAKGGPGGIWWPRCQSKIPPPLRKGGENPAAQCISRDSSRASETISSMVRQAPAASNTARDDHASEEVLQAAPQPKCHRGSTREWTFCRCSMNYRRWHAMG